MPPKQRIDRSQRSIQVNHSLRGILRCGSELVSLCNSKTSRNNDDTREYCSSKQPHVHLSSRHQQPRRNRRFYASSCLRASSCSTQSYHLKPFGDHALVVDIDRVAVVSHTCLVQQVWLERVGPLDPAILRRVGNVITRKRNQTLVEELRKAGVEVLIGKECAGEQAASFGSVPGNLQYTFSSLSRSQALVDLHLRNMHQFTHLQSPLFFQIPRRSTHS